MCHRGSVMIRTGRRSQNQSPFVSQDLRHGDFHTMTMMANSKVETLVRKEFHLPHAAVRRWPSQGCREGPHADDKSFVDCRGTLVLDVNLLADLALVFEDELNLGVYSL